MTISKGSRVAVNLAPFIGAQSPSRHRVACRVLEVREGAVLVHTENPYRSVSLWVGADWVEPLSAEAHDPRSRRPASAVVS